MGGLSNPSPQEVTERFSHPITEQIFSADIGGRHSVFKISQLNPPKDATFQVGQGFFKLVVRVNPSF